MPAAWCKDTESLFGFVIGELLGCLCGYLYYLAVALWRFQGADLPVRLAAYESHSCCCCCRGLLQGGCLREDSECKCEEECSRDGGGGKPDFFEHARADVAFVFELNKSISQALQRR